MNIKDAVKELLVASGTFSFDSKLPIADSNGNLTGMVKMDMLALFTDESIKVAITRVSDHYPLMVSPRAWIASYNSASYIVDGVVIQDSANTFVIAKDENNLSWGNGEDAYADTGNAYISGNANTYKALRDFDGVERTAKILAVTKYQETDRAPGWCNAYTTVTDYSSGKSYDVRKAGCWRIPTLGELNIIYSKKNKINALMLLINGTTLSDAWYWSCTEWGSHHSWHLFLDDGHVGNGSGKDHQGRVRPVCNF